MIGTALIYFFTTIANFFIGLLPTGTLPEAAGTFLTSVVAQIVGFAEVFPFVDDLLIVLGLGLAVELAYVTWKGATYILNLIRGSGA